MGRLEIGRGEGEKYYLFFTKPTKVGDYIEIVQDKITENKITNFKQAYFLIIAPKEVVVLRGEHVRQDGGLDVIIKKIKAGESILKKKSFRDK